MATPTSLPATFVAGAILTADQQNNLRGGFRVLQVIAATPVTSVVGSSSINYGDVGLTATITPQANTNKVLVVTMNACGKTAGNASNGVFLQLLRGATVISTYSFGLFTGTAIVNVGSLDMTVLDSPATTSATTYKVQMKNNVAAAQVEYASNSTPCQMFLLEISA